MSLMSLALAKWSWRRYLQIVEDMRQLGVSTMRMQEV